MIKGYYVKAKAGDTPPESATYAIGRLSSISGSPASTASISLTKIWDTKFDFVSGGNGFMAGIKNGELFTWGNNTNGQTAQGTASGVTLKPTKVGSFTDWVFVSLGDSHGAGIRANGTLWTWGNNTNGRTGLGTTAGNTLNPTQVGTDTDWTYVNCGINHTVAIKGGKILTCGNNANGRLGQNLAASASTNIDVFTELNGGSTGWTHASAGTFQTLGIRNGDIWSAGAQAGGRLGNGLVVAVSIIAITQVTTSGDYLEINTGNDTSIAIKTNGTLWGTGNQDGGRLGNGGTGNISVFTQIGTDNDWQKISMVNNSATTIIANYVVAKKGGKVWVTGNNQAGQLGILDDTSVVTTWTKLSDITVDKISNNSWGQTIVTI